MRLRLIEPSSYQRDGTLLKSRWLFFPSLNLPYLAALAPEDVQVAITVEQIEDVDLDEAVDLVGITAYTTQILRAYEIADRFRARGVPVVMGGIHVSMAPDEALDHADTVIVGEADETWPQFLNDFRNGRPARLYQAARRPPLVNLPRPKFSLLDRSRFLGYGRSRLYRLLGMPVYPVQTARGCPNSCEFCSVTSFNGRAYRHRPVGEVIREIESLGAATIFFTDDNLLGVRRRAVELLEALAPLRLSWVGQAGIAAADDEDLIALAARSGCAELFLGIESLSASCLESVGKTVNRVDQYERWLKVFADHGIGATASLMFGFDGDGPSVFRDAFEFLEHNRVAHSFWWPVTPFPGTVLYEKLRAEGRLKDDKWWLDRDLSAGFPDLKFSPAGMAEDLFTREFRRCYRLYASAGRTVRRALQRPLRRCLWRLAYGVGAGRMLRYGRLMAPGNGRPRTARSRGSP